MNNLNLLIGERPLGVASSVFCFGPKDAGAQRFQSEPPEHQSDLSLGLASFLLSSASNR